MSWNMQKRTRKDFCKRVLNRLSKEYRSSIICLQEKGDWAHGRSSSHVFLADKTSDVAILVPHRITHQIHFFENIGPYVALLHIGDIVVVNVAPRRPAQRGSLEC